MASEVYLILVIVVMAAATFSTRILPFLLLGGVGRHPAVSYLGRYLPPIVMTLLVIHSLKDVPLTEAPHGLPHAAAVGLTALLHLWRRNALLSIGAGTFLFMWLQQTGLAAAA